MTKVYKEIIGTLLVLSLVNIIFIFKLYPQDGNPNKTVGNIDGSNKPLSDKVEKKDMLDDLALPADLGDFKFKEGGAVYYSPTIKNRILIPIYFWGEIDKTGLHYMPAGTNLVRGLSLAGGPKSTADMANVKIFRNKDGKSEIVQFNLNDSSQEQLIHEFELKPSDVVRIERDSFYENRAYYTSLIGIGVTVLSGILTYQTIKDNN